MQEHSFWRWLLLLSFVSNIGLVGWFFSHTDQPVADTSLQESYEKYPFLSKRIFIPDGNHLIINFIPLRQALRDYVLAQNDTVGVYFEYLPTGTSVGVRDREAVRLASLAKVPLAMSIMKKVASGKLALDDVIILEEGDLDDRFGVLYERGAGAEFSIQELLEELLINSDNTSYQALFRLLTPQEINDVYENLNVEVVDEGEERSTLVSPKDYSSILRALYLSTYLRKEDSNFILEILSRTKFTDKLRAGVPENVKVSHKIGVFMEEGGDETRTDCGIIYVPYRPYLLCTFVKDNEEGAEKKITHISKIVYGYISRASEKEVE